MSTPNGDNRSGTMMMFGAVNPDPNNPNPAQNPAGPVGAPHMGAPASGAEFMPVATASSPPRQLKDQTHTAVLNAEEMRAMLAQANAANAANAAKNAGHANNNTSNNAGPKVFGVDAMNAGASNNAGSQIGNSESNKKNLLIVAALALLIVLAVVGYVLSR